MQRGEKLWVLDEGAWQEASYEFRVEKGEPLGKHSVMLANGGGRRVVCSCDTDTGGEPPPSREPSPPDAGEATLTDAQVSWACDKHNVQDTLERYYFTAGLREGFAAGRASTKAQQAPLLRPAVTPPPVSTPPAGPSWPKEPPTRARIDSVPSPEEVTK